MPQRGGIGAGGYLDFLKASGLGKVMDLDANKLGKTTTDLTPQPQVRAGANALPSRQLGGDYIPSNMSNLNPTNAKSFGRETMKYGLAAPWNDPIWMAPAYHGHNRSIQRDMERMSQMQVAERMRRDEQTLNNLSVGSNNPIYYPPPTAQEPSIVPNRSKDTYGGLEDLQAQESAAQGIQGNQFQDLSSLIRYLRSQQGR